MNKALRKRIGQHIRQRRESLGLSMYAIGKSTGLDASQVRQIELGQPGLSIESADAIAKALQWQLADVFKV